MQERRFLIPIVLCGALAACGPMDGWPDSLEEARDEIQRSEIAAEIEERIVDELECSGTLRPSTLDRIRSLLRDPSYDTVIDLLTAPDDLAQLVSLAGTEVEGAVLLLRNIALIYEQGHVQRLLDEGWQGVEVDCGDVVTLACTAGSGSSTARCDGGEPFAVELRFEGCVLGGTKYEGAVAFDRTIDDDTAVEVSFDELTFDEVEEIDGRCRLESTIGATSQELALDTGAQLALTSHGGPNSGRSCGQRATLSRFRLRHQAGLGILELSAAVEQPTATYGVRTTGDHLSYAEPIACACPRPGSGLEITVPNPIPGDNQSGTLQINFGAAAESGLCASVSVQATDWPTECATVGNPQPDCGRAAVQRVTADLVSAFCTLL